MATGQARSGEFAMQAEEGMEQYLSFMLAGEEYGLDILRVQEIKSWCGVTHMPNMPEYILGVMNLRGSVVPVIDLRRYFDMGSADFGRTTVVVVVRVGAHGSGERTIGMVVDAVSEVYSMTQEDLKPAPDFAAAVNTDSIMGLAMQEDRLVIVLDIEHLINEVVLQELDRADD